VNDRRQYENGGKGGGDNRLWGVGQGHVLAGVMDRPIGKIIQAGKLKLEGYDEYLGMQEKALREILESVS
jgi:hypothetical protein